MPSVRASAAPLLVACIVAAWCGIGSRATALESPSPVVYPARRIPIRFDHRRHAKVGTTCVYCHTRATTSRAGGDRLLPPPERCDACHGTDHARAQVVGTGVGAAAECSFCHQGYRPEDG